MGALRYAAADSSARYARSTRAVHTPVLPQAEKSAVLQGCLNPVWALEARRRRRSLIACRHCQDGRPAHWVTCDVEKRLAAQANAGFSRAHRTDERPSADEHMGLEMLVLDAPASHDQRHAAWLGAGGEHRIVSSQDGCSRVAHDYPLMRGTKHVAGHRPELTTRPRASRDLGPSPLDLRSEA